jgi:hypothetical protein
MSLCKYGDYIKQVWKQMGVANIHYYGRKKVFITSPSCPCYRAKMAKIENQRYETSTEKIAVN